VGEEDPLPIDRLLHGLAARGARRRVLGLSKGEGGRGGAEVVVVVVAEEEEITSRSLMAERGHRRKARRPSKMATRVYPAYGNG
jgi:hypothetical protein